MLTAARFFPNPHAETPNKRIYKSGDRARFLPDKQIEFLGRADCQVKMRGFRIELEEIDSVLREHPLIRQAVTKLNVDDDGRTSLISYVVPIEPSINVVALRQYLEKKLPTHMIPNVFFELIELPLLPNGKVDRTSLPEIEQISPQQQDQSPRTETEKKLVEIWSESLRIDNIGIHGHFFEMGGHSLLVTRAISRIRSAFHIRLSPLSLFEFPTVSKMAQHIESIKNVAEKKPKAGQAASSHEEGEI
jgi:acyl carrier protein